MILTFTLENWMSFRDPVTFSMVGTAERQHAERVPRVDKYRTKILPVAAIYGGNASGKTNFFQALSFAKRFVTQGVLPDARIPVEPFRLDPAMIERPSRFAFELLIDERVYAYEFAVTPKAVLEEKLTLILSTGEKLLYHRRGDACDFGKGLKTDARLKFAFEGTQANRLFLTNSVSQKIDSFRPLHDWFRDRLELIAPDARFQGFDEFFGEGDPLHAVMNELLPQLDTGIARVCGESVALDALDLPATLEAELQEKVLEGMSVRLLNDGRGDRIILTREEGELHARKLVTWHTRSDGTEARFEFRQESDGSRRVVDLLPAFLDLARQDSSRVYVIDEIDRSLHTLLTRRLVQAYLDQCTPQTRTQLLFTTHDVLLMDQHILRRDEMWVAERGPSGNSTLTAFSEFEDVRNDKDLRKSYLQGRLGGIPRLTIDLAERPESRGNECPTVH